MEKNAQTCEAKEQEILEKAIEQKDAAEAEKRKAQKERNEAMYTIIEEYKFQDAAVKMKQKQKEQDLRTWEMMQRFKRNEYDKQTNLEERKLQLQQKQQYGKELRKNIVRIHSFNLVIIRIAIIYLPFKIPIFIKSVIHILRYFT